MTVGRGKPAVTSQVKSTSCPGSTTTVSFTDSRIIGGAGDTGEEERSREDYRKSKSLSLWKRTTLFFLCFATVVQDCGGLLTPTPADGVSDVNCLSAPEIDSNEEFLLGLQDGYMLLHVSDDII